MYLSDLENSCDMQRISGVVLEVLETCKAIHEIYRDKENFSKPLRDFIFQIVFSKLVEYLGA